VTVGPKGVEGGIVEVTGRKGLEKSELPLSGVVAELSGAIADARYGI
jgi:hypothetical protein